MSCLVFGRERNIVDIILRGGGWFVSCIMIYYVFLFFIRRYCINYLNIVFASSLVVSALLYFMFVDGLNYNMYGDTYYKWFHYFLFMLQGAMLGHHSKKQKLEVRNGKMEFLKSVACAILFYILCSFKSSDAFNIVQVASLLPLLGVTYYTYRFCNSEKLKRLYRNTKIGLFMSFAGGLCLEVYLIQSSLFTDKLNFIFPLNIPVVFLEVLVGAYILRCMGRVWSQTFKETDYNWKEVFRAF